MSFKVTKAQHVLAVEDFEAAVAYSPKSSVLPSTAKSATGPSCNSEISGSDDLHQPHLARQVPVKEPISDKPWGLRKFLVETPEGHHIRFGQAQRWATTEKV